ncbi:MAG: DnaJ domain-containing protein [Gammaproteobacteria bacterium]
MIQNILQLALDFFRAPSQYDYLTDSSVDLPQDVDLLLELAAGNSQKPSVLLSPEFKNVPPTELLAAVTFFAERVLLSSRGNWYRMLGLFPGASLQEVSRNYKLLLHLFHLDKSDKADEWNAEYAMRLNRAYSILRDPEKKRLYDNKLRAQGIDFSRPSTASNLATGFGASSSEQINEKPVVSFSASVLSSPGGSLVDQVNHPHKDSSDELEQDYGSQPKIKPIGKSYVARNIDRAYDAVNDVNDVVPPKLDNIGEQKSNYSEDSPKQSNMQSDVTIVLKKESLDYQGSGQKKTRAATARDRYSQPSNSKPVMVGGITALAIILLYVGFTMLSSSDDEQIPPTDIVQSDRIDRDQLANLPPVDTEEPVVETEVNASLSVGMAEQESQTVNNDLVEPEAPIDSGPISVSPASSTADVEKLPAADIPNVLEDNEFAKNIDNNGDIQSGKNPASVSDDSVLQPISTANLNAERFTPGADQPVNHLTAQQDAEMSMVSGPLLDQPNQPEQSQDTSTIMPDVQNAFVDAEIENSINEFASNREFAEIPDNSTVDDFLVPGSSDSPVEPSGNSETVEVQTALTRDELEVTIDNFVTFYEEGNLARFISLFSHDVVTDDHDSLVGVMKDYRALFAATEKREFFLGKIVWQIQGGFASGSADFHVRVQRVNSDELKSYYGQVEFNVEKRDNANLITKVVHTYH